MVNEPKRTIRIAGLTSDEWLALPDEYWNEIILTGKPVCFQTGSADILGEFRVVDDRLEVQLAHVDGGGEGVLSAVWLLAPRFAKRRGLKQVDWLIHATHCANPNLKLKRVLERKGFVIKTLPSGITVYCQTIEVNEA